jgi:hypothetical protein
VEVLAVATKLTGELTVEPPAGLETATAPDADEVKASETNRVAKSNAPHGFMLQYSCGCVFG